MNVSRYLRYHIFLLLCITWADAALALSNHDQLSKELTPTVSCFAALKNIFLPQRSQLYLPTKKMVLSGSHVKPKGAICPFCVQMAETADEKNLILGRSVHSILALNFYPCFDGHMLVIPRRHVGTLSELSLEERADLMALTVVATEVLTTVLHAEGTNVGINMGRAAGASIPDHLHVQIVPRWDQYRDTFLQIYGNVSLVMHTLPEMYALLAPAVAQKLASAL